MTNTEATIVLAFRANVSPGRICALVGMTTEQVDTILMRFPHFRIDTDEVLKALVAK